MKLTELQKEIFKLMELFQGSFINGLNELILIPKTNLYFRLEDIETLLDLKCKIIAWCSRACCKAEPYIKAISNKKYQESVRKKINKYLGTDFCEKEWLLIYIYLGNGINKNLCEKFINSDYNLELLVR